MERFIGLAGLDMIHVPFAGIAPERFPAFLREDRQRWKEAVARIDPAKFKP